MNVSFSAFMYNKEIDKELGEVINELEKTSVALTKLENLRKEIEELPIDSYKWLSESSELFSELIRFRDVKKLELKDYNIKTRLTDFEEFITTLLVTKDSLMINRGEIIPYKKLKKIVDKGNLYTLFKKVCSNLL